MILVFFCNSNTFLALLGPNSIRAIYNYDVRNFPTESFAVSLMRFRSCCQSSTTEIFPLPCFNISNNHVFDMIHKHIMKV
ncbi:hypothetical protein H2248_008066 [Termitomyces sp. 'cryptogamus']|nr:hypothetical protein H2248_008066 [Termitomyces sp. 'cryptogamus']